jgi:hypothetical protein
VVVAALQDGAGGGGECMGAYGWNRAHEIGSFISGGDICLGVLVLASERRVRERKKTV